MSHVLGVDAGNTKTVALVARLDGTIVGSGRAGCGDIYGAVSEAAALTAVTSAVHAALGTAQVDHARLVAGAFNMAGADWPEDFDFIHAAMLERGFGQIVTVVNDAVGALWAGSPDRTGVAVVCGTGVGISARSADDHVWHTSFWQEPHGASQLGEKALRAVYRAELGIDPPTSLTARVLSYLGCASVEEVLHLFTARPRAAPPTGPLARVLLDEANHGDAAAYHIVLSHGAMLGDYANAAARKVGIAGEPFTLVLSGGVLRHPSRLLADALIAQVRVASPGARPIFSRFEPVTGALFMALEAAGVQIDQTVTDRLSTTLPPAAFFAT